MLPAGRRQSTLLTFLPLLVLCSFVSDALAVSAVLGIDFGTEYIKAAIAKPGSPIEIVLTKDSKRKEAAALAFKPSRTQINDANAFPERLYGGDALALSARFPTDVYLNLKSVLGLSTSSTAVKDYLNRYPGLQDTTVVRTDAQDDGSSLAFKSQSLSNDGTFMVEELVAMELKNIKANAEAAVGKGSQITDTVITVPAYYTAEERRALELAADLAGLRVIGLITDGLAVGLNYATHRTFETASQGGKPEHHVVYDMGAGSTTATVLRFQGKTIKGPGKKNTTYQEVQILGFGADQTLGGDSLNDLIVTDMITKFIESPRMKPYGLSPIEVRKHGKTMARLWKDSEKVRQVLSANSVAHSTQEGLFYEDVTFKYKLDRDEFEQLARDHTGRVAGPLNEALLMADLRIDDIDSVILHGGLTRTPFVQKQLEETAGGPSKLKPNVNADEAAVMGAAFRAASISPSYRVKDIRGLDIAGASYTISWTQEGKTKEQKIFVPTTSVGVEKQLMVKAQADTTVKFVLDSVTKKPVEVLSVELTNLTKSVAELKDKYGCASGNITTLFHARLNPASGIPELSSASVSCKPVKVKDAGVIDSVKGILGFGKKDQEPLQDDIEASTDDAAASTPLPVDDPTSSETIVSSATAVDNSSTAIQPSSASSKPKPLPSIIVIPLLRKEVIQGLNQPPSEQLPLIQKRLASFDSSDQDTVLRAEALNVLEAYTYRARDYLEDATFLEVSTTKVREQLEKSLTSVSEWLYGDGVDAKLDDFKAKLKSLQSIIDPVLKRKDEGNKREAAIELMKSGLSSAEKMMEMVKSSIEKAASAASASASSAASAASQEASSIASTGTGELDEDPYATSSSASASETDSTFPKMYEYTEADLSTLVKAYDTAKQWFDGKVAAQGKLSKYDDPVLLVADLEAKANQLQKASTNLLMKSINFAGSAKPKKSKASKKDKTKTKKTKSSTSGETQSTGSSSIKDEL